VQFPPPVFCWESELQPETGREAMHETACLLNQDLAARLHHAHKPKSVLDIGSKYPYFLKCFKDLGVETLLGIDGFPEAEEYGEELGVPMVVGDFLEHDFGDQKFDLISLVHCIEHFSDPAAVLHKIKGLLTETGTIYIRTPEVNTPGIDIHLTEEHYQVHPIMFSRESFRRLAAKVDLRIFDEWVQEEVGQIDWQLRAKEDIRISFAVTSCNEEEVIGRMLDSIEPLAWEVVVYLNNCDDDTPNIIEAFGKRTGIRTRIMHGYWDNNFARAKNAAIMECEGTHVAWMDCDDVLSDDAPAKILALLEEYPDNPQDWRLLYGGNTFFHLRLWRNKARIDRAGQSFKPHFHDKCHEYVRLGGYDGMKLKCDDITLRHLPKPKDACSRNIEILMAAEAEGPQPCEYCNGNHDDVGRTLFYLGNGLREGGQHEEALKRYNHYLYMGLGWHDEKFWAWMYKGNCHQGLQQLPEAMSAYCNALAVNPHWAEPYMYIARLQYEQKNYMAAVSWAVHAAAQTLPNTLMFLHTEEYKDRPWRLLSYSWEQLGDLDKAIQYGEVASQKIGGPDSSWDLRLSALRAQRAQKVKAAPTDKIAQVMRPGALGDIVMSTAACKGLKQAGYHVRYVCHPSSIEAIRDNPYVDEIIGVPDNNWDKILEQTSNLPQAERVVGFQYPMNERYPEEPMRQHLAHFFCEQAGVPVSLDLSMGFQQEHLDFGSLHGSNKVLIHTTAGWSPMKNWPADYWEELVQQLVQDGHEVVQIGSEKEAVVPGATKLGTPSIRHAAAAQKFCKLFIGGDSVFNHTSQVVGKRSIILWGSTHPCGSGYDQNVNLVNGEVWTREMGNQGPTKPCQPCYREYNAISAHPKPPCPHLVSHGISTLPEEEYPTNTLNACMASNLPNLVIKLAREILS
jgi:ADP-heptose:LPS heptosyltransferase/glycosyltransferase involved in cell wall biosynthesis